MTMEELTQLDLSEKYKQYIEEGVVDPEQMAERAMHEIPEEEQKAIIRFGLRERFHDYIRNARQNRRKPRVTNTQDRWEAVRSILAQPEFVHGNWKALGECSVADLADSIQQYEALAEANLNEAARRRKLLQAMKRSDSKTVADLGVEKVVEILSG